MEPEKRPPSRSAPARSFRLHFTVEELPESEVKASIAHGILHTALGHQWSRGGRSEEAWNPATDEAVNWMLKESEFDLPTPPSPAKSSRTRAPRKYTWSWRKKRRRRAAEGLTRSLRRAGGEPGKGEQEGPTGRGGRGRGFLDDLISNC
ncbi:hypothetical protein AKJ64_01300 [candidate division MSBL1 archaeon SCGC-AAA259E17]|uniref:Putative metallopeptidase domain-containing protein n=1 Tax=candidate division MSBL1 archaeon SCGC-AAA259E17 TaxID=1698263 RepID=A0A133UG19_9EURY|nr:hypothetical protein AKJ64_01300 [candidate division MSBL1 archaeon SCGC-AAA259E17]